MECSICYEKIFIPKTKEDFEEIKNKIKELENNHEELEKFYNLVIVPNHDTTFTCSTPNCGSLICRDCWTKIKFKNIGLETFSLDNIDSMLNTFICPYCRKPDWKDYMNNTFIQLAIKLSEIKNR